MTGVPEPLAQGDLERTPFAHVLLYVQRRALEGTLVVWRPEPEQARPKQKAITCDLCAGLKEPSCVYACPHEAALRVDPRAFFGEGAA